MAEPHIDTCNGGPHTRCDVVGTTVLGDTAVDWCALKIRVCVYFRACLRKAVVIQAQALENIVIR